MNDSSPTPSAVFDLAEQAIVLVRKTIDVTLDYTPETLPVLDHYLTEVPKDQAHTVRLIAVAAGAYFGEVVRKCVAGNWKDLSVDPLEWRMTLPGKVEFSPIGLSAGAILYSDDIDLDCVIDIPAAKRQIVDEALAKRPRVREQEYFSLSGRLETLQYIMDLVAGQPDELPN